MAKKKMKKQEPEKSRMHHAAPMKQVQVVQYSDTYYTATSASLDSLPTLSDESVSDAINNKKTRKSGEITGNKNEKNAWATDFITEKKKKRKGKGKAKHKEDDIMQIEKPKNWSRMSKKERDDWLLQQMVQRKVLLEAARIQRKERLRLAAKERIEISTDEANKQDIRNDILAKMSFLFRKHEKLGKEHDLKDMLQAQWKSYIKCDGLPDPTKPPQLNEYLSRWKNITYHDCTEEELCKRFHEVLTTLNVIDVFMTTSWAMPPETVKNMKQACFDLRRQLIRAIEYTSYNILRHMDKNLKFLSCKVATYHKEIKDLKLRVWVAIRQPTRLPIERNKLIEPPPPEDMVLDFPDLHLCVILPPFINTSDISVQVARNLADLYSPFCNTFDLGCDIPNINEDIYTLSVKEYDYVRRVSMENEEFITSFYKQTDVRIKELEKYIKQNPYFRLEQEKAELEELQLAEPPPRPGLQNPRERVYKENDDELKVFLLLNSPILYTDDINLRKYRICGGVLHINLFETPPQSKYNGNGVHLSTILLPSEMKDINYQVNYKLPIRVPPKDKKEKDKKKRKAEEEALKEAIERQNKENEVEKEKLIQVHTIVPQNVICLETPIVCQWDKENSVWTIHNVFEIEYDKIDFSLKFRISKLWPIGIAIPKYSNMPYKNWEMIKDPDGKGILFSVQGVYMSVKILCRNRVVVLKEVSFRNTPTDFKHFRQYLNHAMSVKNLKRIFREVGIDIFPDFDAHNYVKGSCIKNWVIEKHMYHAMAFLSKAYCFKFSKWNCQAGTRNIVCQIKDSINTKKESKYQLLYANPESFTYLKEGEDMENFSNESAYGTDFFPDLFTFNMLHGSVETKKRILSMDYKLTETILELLEEIKPCSFS